MDDSTMPSMELDEMGTSIAPSGPGLLKRSNSAPMINVLPDASGAHHKIVSQSSPTSSISSGPTSAIASSSTGSTAPPKCITPVQTKPADVSRIRRFSASCTVGMHSPTGKLPSRLDQIKHEESYHRDREVAHEREIQSAVNLSASCEELSLSDEPMVTDNKRPKSFNEPLHIFTTPMVYSSSPSPTRLGKQCFSPSLQQPVRNNTLTPSPSPSPTRKTFVRRSLSPITMRPSPLSGIKRKADLDDLDRPESYFSPPKRLQPGSCSPIRMPSVHHPFIHSISGSSISPASSLGSPDVHTLPNSSCSTVMQQQSPQISAQQSSQSLASTSHPVQSLNNQINLTSSVSTSHVNMMPMTGLAFSSSLTTPASCFTFRPVRDSTDTHTTDSDQASDMTETTDISEMGDITCASNIDASSNNSFRNTKSTALL